MLACHLIVRAKSEDVHATLQQVASEQAFDADELTARLKISELLQFYDLEVIPGIETGRFEIERIFRAKQVDTAKRRIDKDLFENGEDDHIEFKSSLYFDRRKFSFGNNISKSDCYSEEVLFSSLKTLAAFANTNGGRLYIGIEDDGNVVGMSDDYECKKNVKNFDRLELFLRDKVRQEFYQGNSFNSYLRCTETNYNGKNIVIVDVSITPKISFIKNRFKNYSLFIRRGNSTQEIHIQEMESYFEIRKMY